MNNVPVYKLRLARTLYNNFYRARLQDANGEDAGQLLIVPGLPLDRSQLPENAPYPAPCLQNSQPKPPRSSIVNFIIPHRLSILHRTKNSLSLFY